MNGQRLIENQIDGKWKTIKVTKAESLKGGIYNIFMAKDADKNEKSDGILVHFTNSELYLKTPFGLSNTIFPEILSYRILDLISVSVMWRTNYQYKILRLNIPTDTPYNVATL